MRFKTLTKPPNYLEKTRDSGTNPTAKFHRYVLGFCMSVLNRQNVTLPLQTGARFFFFFLICYKNVRTVCTLCFIEMTDISLHVIFFFWMFGALKGLLATTRPEGRLSRTVCSIMLTYASATHEKVISCVLCRPPGSYIHSVESVTVSPASFSAHTFRFNFLVFCFLFFFSRF